MGVRANDFTIFGAPIADIRGDIIELEAEPSPAPRLTIQIVKPDKEGHTFVSDQFALNLLRRSPEELTGKEFRVLNRMVLRMK
jgi:hypothetical protein